ncbi:MAG: (deoxy)nucleoside triphosphate pyrophosphohydrolase [Desulfobacterales bacterium]|nr:(deoxy)nucleoside triphosphate pyrophosphohydrolase [Desulfobacterales bacterium]
MFLIQKRPPSGLLAGLWEFPGGKVKSGETQKKALIREMREELNSKVQGAHFLVSVRHSYTHFQVTLHAFECELEQIPRLDKSVQRWVTLKGIHRYPLPSGSVKIIRYLEDLNKHKESRDEDS